MTLTEAIEREAQRVEMFAEMAEACAVEGPWQDAGARGFYRNRYTYRSHVAYLAMARLSERAA